MDTIYEFLSEDHRKCDGEFAEMEEEAGTEEGKELYENFIKGMEHHFCMEEQILFPAMVKITGSEAGPIMIMKMEHEQMRNIFRRMDECVDSDREEFLSLCETLNILIQQHNMKEEQILYPMAENLLKSGQKNVIAAMQDGICRKD